MQWPSRAALVLALASSSSFFQVSAEEIELETLTESRCAAAVKKVQDAGKYTEEAILPICSAEVKSSKCDFFAEALSLATTHTDFTTKVFCKDISEARACSQIMESLFSSQTEGDLLYGECMRSHGAEGDKYCSKFHTLLAMSVQNQDLDTMRACYMMQAYDNDDSSKTTTKPPASEKPAKLNAEKPAKATTNKTKSVNVKPALTTATNKTKSANVKPTSAAAKPVQNTSAIQVAKKKNGTAKVAKATAHGAPQPAKKSSPATAKNKTEVKPHAGLVQKKSKDAPKAKPTEAPKDKKEYGGFMSAFIP